MVAHVKLFGYMSCSNYFLTPLAKHFIYESVGKNLEFSVLV